MAMLRATVFLFLLTSSVLARTLPPTDTDHDTNTIDETIDGSYTDDTAINEDSAKPTCTPDYAKMKFEDCKMFQGISNKLPTAVCVRADGSFVVTTSMYKSPLVYMYDKCGWTQKRIHLPSETLIGGGCAFSKTKLYYADRLGKKIMQFSYDGTFEKNFATNLEYMRLTAGGDMLYSTISGSRDIYAFNISSPTLKSYSFKAVGIPFGIALDPAGNVHVLFEGKSVEVMSPRGDKLGMRSYGQLTNGGSITVDSQYNLVVVERVQHKVFVFDRTGALIKTISGFGDPIDVALGYQCKSLIVVDFSHNGFYLM